MPSGSARIHNCSQIWCLAAVEGWEWRFRKQRRRAREQDFDRIQTTLQVSYERVDI
jgi:hypothetical protein